MKRMSFLVLLSVAMLASAASAAVFEISYANSTTWESTMTRSYGGSDSATYAFVGAWDNGVGAAGPELYRTWLKFDIPVIPAGEVIDSVEFAHSLHQLTQVSVEEELAQVNEAQWFVRPLRFLHDLHRSVVDDCGFLNRVAPGEVFGDGWTHGKHRSSPPNQEALLESPPGPGHAPHCSS